LETTVAQIRSLLELLPGTTFRHASAVEGTAKLSFSIASIESLSVVHYCCGGANLSLNVYSAAPRRPVSGWANPTHLWMDLSVSKQKSLELLGIYLVWYLYETGLLEEDEANRLLERWQGQRVPR
jgi:hypothetical protein